MKIQSLLRPKTVFFALCLGAAPVACSVENDDDDEDGAGDEDVDVDVDDEDMDELELCQSDCDEDDSQCLLDCELELVNDCGDHC